MFEVVPAWVIPVAGALLMLILMVYLANLYHTAAPDEALIIYGFRGPRVVVGGGTVIFPVVENYRRLSLELMSFEIAPEQHLQTSDGAVVAVEAMAQVKVKPNLEAIQAAAEWFLSKTVEQREELIRQLMESRLRTIIAHLTVEQIVREPEKLADDMRLSCAVDIDKMGLDIVSFRIKQIREQNIKR